MTDKWKVKLLMNKSHQHESDIIGLKVMNKKYYYMYFFCNLMMVIAFLSASCRIDKLEKKIEEMGNT